MWQIFRNEIEKKNALDCNFNLLKGFLNELSNIDFQLTNKIMDQTLEDEVLARIFPSLQMSYTLDNKEFVRLKKSLELGIAPVSKYSNLAYNYRNNDNDEDFAEIIEMILNDCFCQAKNVPPYQSNCVPPSLKKRRRRKYSFCS